MRFSTFFRTEKPVLFRSFTQFPQSFPQAVGSLAPVKQSEFFLALSVDGASDFGKIAPPCGNTREPRAMPSLGEDARILREALAENAKFAFVS